MILDDHVLSGEGWAIRLTLSLAGIAWEHRVADLFAEPRPRVPVLTDDEGRVFPDWTGALAAIAAGRGGAAALGPADAGERAAIGRWLAFAAADLAPVLRLREARLFDWPASGDAEAAARRGLRRLDDALIERRILGQGFLVADRPTVADVACLPAVALADDAGLALDACHGLVGWLDRMTALPGFLPMPGVVALPAEDPAGA